MNVTGSFTTTASVVGLRSLASAPDLLSAVPTLRDVHAGAPGVVQAIFSPVIALGRIPLVTTITTVEDGDDGASLHVVGRRGVQSVDVVLTLRFGSADEGTVVDWSAEVVVRGNMASVGQRVARDIAGRAIGQVLADAATAAASGVVGAR